MHSKVPVFVQVKDISQATSLALNFANFPFLTQEELTIKLALLKEDIQKDLVIASIQKNTLFFI